MKNKIVVLYSMDGCPHCTNIKSMLKENNIDYLEHNIREYEKEYNEFVKETKNEYLPAFTLIKINRENDYEVDFLTPDDSFNDLNEAVDKIKHFLL